MKHLLRSAPNFFFKSKLVYLNKGPVERGEEPPEHKRTQALEALEYARTQSIILTDLEADALKTAIESANLSEGFNRTTKKVPHSLLIDFFASNPLMIHLNEIIVASREKQSKNPDIPFVEIFKITVAYRNGLLDKFE